MTASARDGTDSPLTEKMVALRDRFTRAAEGVRDGSVPDAIHDVRVATRRLDAALDLWRAVIPGRRRRRARRSLRALRRDLGTARETQVLIALLREWLPGLTSEPRVAAAFVLERLTRRLGRLEARAARRCGRDSIKRVMRRLERAWGNVEAAVARDPGVTDAAQARLEARAASARSALEFALMTGHPETLHQARVAAKRWRYSIEWLPRDADGESTPIPQLTAVQEVLGRIHDDFMLHERLERTARKMEGAVRGPGLAALQELVSRVAHDQDQRIESFRRMAAGIVGRPTVLTLREVEGEREARGGG